MGAPLVTGWTGPVEYQLKADGTPVNLTGMTVALVLKDRTAVAVDTSGKVVVIDAPTGKVRYSPATTDLDHTKEPYGAHWKVTDGGGKDVFFPSGDADEWRVFPQGGS